MSKMADIFGITAATGTGKSTMFRKFGEKVTVPYNGKDYFPLIIMKVNFVYIIIIDGDFKSSCKFEDSLPTSYIAFVLEAFLLSKYTSENQKEKLREALRAYNLSIYVVSHSDPRSDFTRERGKAIVVTRRNNREWIELNRDNLTDRDWPEDHILESQESYYDELTKECKTIVLQDDSFLSQENTLVDILCETLRHVSDYGHGEVETFKDLEQHIDDLFYEIKSLNQPEFDNEKQINRFYSDLILNRVFNTPFEYAEFDEDDGSDFWDKHDVSDLEEELYNDEAEEERREEQSRTWSEEIRRSNR